MKPDIPAYSKVSKVLSLRQKAAQLFMPAAFINDTELEIRELESLIQNHEIGGLCFFHSRASAATNFEGKREIPYNENSLERLGQLIDRYQRASRYPLLISIDAEWGLAMRVEHAPQYPYALTLGGLNPDAESLLYDLGVSMASDCRNIGIHINLAPVADVNTNPDNPVIGFRAFGSNPEDVGRKAVQFYRGMADGGVLGCAKHFPGHGDTNMDSHLHLPILQKTLADLRQEELPPFEALIKAGIPLVMTGHLSLPQIDPSGIPASLSKPMIDLLRKMGFEGVVITDALNMHALRGIEEKEEHLNIRALKAGNDLLCFADRIPESIDLLLSKVSKVHLENSFQRVWQIKEKALGEKSLVEPKREVYHLNLELARQTLCEVKMDKGLLAEFKDSGFSMVSVGEPPKIFIDSLKKTFNFDHFPCPKGTGIQNLIPENRNILLALHPPSMKPKGFFGLDESLMAELRSLSKTHKVLLYLFGNPYLLRLLPIEQLQGIVSAYQAFPAFQEMAGLHFKGGFEARGVNPINLTNEK